MPEREPDWDTVAEQEIEARRDAAAWDVECNCPCHGDTMSMICGTCCDGAEPCPVEVVFAYAAIPCTFSRGHDGQHSYITPTAKPEPATPPRCPSCGHVAATCDGIECYWCPEGYCEDRKDTR